MFGVARRRVHRSIGLVLVLVVLVGSALAAPQSLQAQSALPPKAAGKLSSRLALLARPDVLARSAADRAVLLSLPPRGAGSLRTNAQQEVLTYIYGDTDQAAVAGLAKAGAKVVHVSGRYHVVTAFVAPSRLNAVAAVRSVRWVQEALTPMRVKPDAPGRAQLSPAQATCPSGIVSEGDTILRADQAREANDIDGSGVTVGVLSDSYDVETFTAIDAEDDVASGDLPGAGNPCGHETPVEVLAEISDPEAGIDEGRAMLQIIHDLAPGAALAFATANEGFFSFADNIHRLRDEAGADVITDDWFYFEEGFFQDDPVSVAIDEVTQDGAIYTTAAGNGFMRDEEGNAIGSYEARKYRPIACPELQENLQSFTPGLDCHDFDSGRGEDSTMGLTLPPGGELVMNFQWSEPWFGVGSDLDIYLVDQDGQVLAASLAENEVLPQEFLYYPNDTDQPQTVELVVARFRNGEREPRIKYILELSFISGAEYTTDNSSDGFGREVFGHAGAAGALSTAAAPFYKPTRPEPYSSRGPFTVYWGPVVDDQPAARLPASIARAKPDVTATDGTQTTFFFTCSDPAVEVCRFYGTSAAAPHAAAVAALMKEQADEQDVSLDQALAEEILEETAAPMQGPERRVGAGLIDAFEAVGGIE